jgi:hypothetical protein
MIRSMLGQMDHHMRCKPGAVGPAGRVDEADPSGAGVLCRGPTREKGTSDLPRRGRDPSARWSVPLVRTGLQRGIGSQPGRPLHDGRPREAEVAGGHDRNFVNRCV